MLGETETQRQADLVGDLLGLDHRAAGADSDDIRLLNGRSRPPVDGLACYDAWELAGADDRGLTWENANPLAAVAM